MTENLIFYFKIVQRLIKFVIAKHFLRKKSNVYRELSQNSTGFIKIQKVTKKFLFLNQIDESKAFAMNNRIIFNL